MTTQELTLLFLITLIGFGLVTRTHEYRYRLLDASNYALFYESAIRGGLWFIIVWIPLELAKMVFLDCLSFAWRTFPICDVNQFAVRNVDALALTAALALAICWTWNRRHPEDVIKERLARDFGLIGNMLVDVANDAALVQVTTMRGKVYVGWLASVPGVSRDGVVQDIALVPLMSGYRDPATQSVVEELNYSNAIRAYGKDVREEAALPSFFEQFSVLIPMAEVCLIRRHLPDFVAFVRTK